MSNQTNKIKIIKPHHITNKQQEIITLLYQFRFLNRIQIQSLLKNKDKKNINILLKDLNGKKYLERIYSTSFGENTKPAIYYIGKNGIKFLKLKENCSKTQIRKLYKENKRSNNFINQSIFLADIYLYLLNKNRKKYSFEVETLSDIANPNSSFHSLFELNPKLAFVKKEGSLSNYYILEIFDLTTPTYSVKKCLRNYLELFFQNTWEDNTGQTFPIILVICPNKSKLINMKILFKRLLDDYQNPEDFHIRFTTIDEVKKHGITNEIWEEIN